MILKAQTTNLAGHSVTIRPIRKTDDMPLIQRRMFGKWRTISDEWQHKGLGKLLMKHLISYAKQYGVRQLYSLELADNTMMRELANEVGMSASRDPHDAHQVVYSLAL